MSECCSENTVVTPTREEVMGKGRRSRGGDIFSIQNPIPGEIKDADSVSKMFYDLKVVPFAGHSNGTGDKLLNWYLMLAKLSPTTGSCINKIKEYVIGSKAKFVRATDPEFDPGTEQLPLSAQEASAYMSAIKEIVEYKHGIVKFHQLLAGSLEATGNAYAELSISTVNGQTRAHIRNVKVADCRYKATKPGEPKIIAVSPVWEPSYIEKRKPDFIPAAPMFVEKDGVMRTMFHLKRGDNEWYGRPTSESADLYKYREVQDALYVIRQSAANFVGQLIIEVEDSEAGDPAIDSIDAGKSGFDSFADRMEANYTQKGEDPSAILVTARPIGSRPMFVFQVKPNTNESWYKATGEINEQKILRSHLLTPRFMGFDVASGFANDAFIEDFMMNVEPVIDKYRGEIMAVSNKILDLVWETAGKPELSQYSITFDSPIKGQIERYKTKNSGSQSSNNAI